MDVIVTIADAELPGEAVIVCGATVMLKSPGGGWAVICKVKG